MDTKEIVDNELKSHLLNLYAMALTDTGVDPTELELLFKIGEERGIGKEEIKNILLYPDQIKFTVPRDIFTKMDYLYDLTRMLLADGVIEEDEVICLKKFLSKFGFATDNVPLIAEFLIEEVKKGTDKATLFEQIKQNL
jgi:hypothetical protein